MLLQENLNFGYIRLTNLYHEHLILLVLIFFNIDNLHISIPLIYNQNVVARKSLVSVWLYESNNANEGP